MRLAPAPFRTRIAAESGFCVPPANFFVQIVKFQLFFRYSSMRNPLVYLVRLFGRRHQLRRNLELERVVPPFDPINSYDPPLNSIDPHFQDPPEFLDPDSACSLDGFKRIGTVTVSSKEFVEEVWFDDGGLT